MKLTKRQTLQLRDEIVGDTELFPKGVLRTIPNFLTKLSISKELKPLLDTTKEVIDMHVISILQLYPSHIKISESSCYIPSHLKLDRTPILPHEDFTLINGNHTINEDAQKARTEVDSFLDSKKEEDLIEINFKVKTQNLGVFQSTEYWEVFVGLLE